MAEDGNRSSLASCRLLFDPDGGRGLMAPLRGPKFREGSGRCFRCRVGFRGFVFFLLCVEGEWVVSAVLVLLL